MTAALKWRLLLLDTPLVGAASPCTSQRVRRRGHPVLGLTADEKLLLGQCRPRAGLHRTGVLRRFPGADLRVRRPARGVVFGGVSTALSNFWLMFFQGFSVWTYGGTILGLRGLQRAFFPVPPRLLTDQPALSALPPRNRVVGLRVFQVHRIPGLSVGARRLPRGQCPAAHPVRRHHGRLGSLLPDGPGQHAHGAELGPVGLAARFQQADGVSSWCCVACALVYGTLRLATPIPAATTASLLLVQQNTDPWDGGKATDRQHLD